MLFKGKKLSSSLKKREKECTSLRTLLTASCQKRTRFGQERPGMKYKRGDFNACLRDIGLDPARYLGTAKHEISELPKRIQFKMKTSNKYKARTFFNFLAC